MSRDMIDYLLRWKSETADRGIRGSISRAITAIEYLELTPSLIATGRTPSGQKLKTMPNLGPMTLKVLESAAAFVNRPEPMIGA